MLKSFHLLRGLTYGPIPTRRFGLSLGINLLPSGRKVCSFDCVYCQLGRAKAKTGDAGLPTLGEVVDAVRQDIHWLRRVNVKPDTMTFSGNGEPTLHPRFEQIVSAVRNLLKTEGEAIPVAVLSNAAHLDRPGVVRALCSVEFPVLKLDAGTEDVFRELNRPRPGLTLDRVVEGIRNVPGAIVQSMFVSAPVDNANPAHVAAWIARVRGTGASSAQIYTLDRAPAHPDVRAVESRKLAWIAGRLGEETGIVADVCFPES